MTMRSQMGRHVVYRLEQSVVSGASMGQRRTYTRGVPITCTVFPKTGQRVVRQGQEGFILPHTIYVYGVHPGLDEEERVLWDDTVMVITGAPRDAGGQGRFWVFEAEARPEENRAVVVE